MLKPFRLATLCVIGCVFLGPAIAQDEAQFSSEIARLTPQLEAVLTGGHWTRDGLAGTFRLIIRAVGFEHIRNEAYLQWIRETSDPYQPHVIERTVPVPEISGWRVIAQRLALDKKQWKIIVTAERENVVEVRPKTERKFFMLIPEGDYTYRVVESTARPRI